ncbi:MarR family winged helix-turn-helix transcriptional regulator [Microbacterium halophytorum]|uniref:MarR family winged helix-turn-helix transcriptional regulator n=1 Tax=Microbacterium halophytorum TaxID=2067568 RepID=UPI00131A4099|nr:MarR family transcriptional regulator [Microbacterium halophytorum]
MVARREALADLADGVVAMAREIESGHRYESVVPLTLNERIALRVIDRAGGIAPSELAELLGLQRSNLSTALRGLEAKGLVTRESGHGDGRGVVVRSTAFAGENLERLRGNWADLLAEVAPPGADLEGAAELLERMTRALIERRRHQD